MFTNVENEIYLFLFASIFILFVVLYVSIYIIIVFVDESIKKIRMEKETIEKRIPFIKREGFVFVYETGQTCKGMYLKNSIHYDTKELHLLYNTSERSVYGLCVTNYLDSKIHTNMDLNTVEKSREHFMIENNQEPFMISFDRILRPSYGSTSIDHKVQFLLEFFQEFYKLEKLIVHNNEKVDILKLNVCMIPLLEKIKQSGVSIEIWNTLEGGFIEKKDF